MIKFNPATALFIEFTMIKYFEKGLKPSVKAEIDQNTTQLDNYKVLVAKAVKIEAKANLRPSSYIQKTNQNCLQGNHLAYTIAHKVQTQKIIKDYYSNKFKVFKAFRSIF